MNTKRTWRLICLVAVLVMLLSTATAAAGQLAPAKGDPRAAAPPQQAAWPEDAKQAPPGKQPAEPPKLPINPKPAQPDVSREDALKKIDPDLRDVVSAAVEEEPLLVHLYAWTLPGEAMPDMSPYFVDGKFVARPPLDFGDRTMHAFVGYAYPRGVLKAAYLAEVEAILSVSLERDAEPDPYPADEARQLPERGPEDWAQLRANADKLREGSLPWSQAPAYGDGRELVRPQDWFEVMPEGPHKAEVAWDRGYTGEGVTVAVIDDGIDAAHPDLMGTQKIYSSTAAPQYNGWPMVYSPFSQLLYAIEASGGPPYMSGGYPSGHFVDTSTTPPLRPCGIGISCFTYQPLIDFATPGLVHTYVVSNSMSQSGVVHVGTHPDFDLRDWVWGEKVAVLVTDPNAAGVYDTVYVDVDDDYDFRDEKPLTRADVHNPGTYNDMIAYRDMNGDGLADLSGGMVYFIADGLNVIPFSDLYWGASCPGFMCPGNGDLVAFSGGTFDRAYSHGTQCASNVVGQGVVNGMLPEFRDLGGTPPGAVFGMAPDAEMVNVSDVYWDFDNSKIAAYQFVAFGYDGIQSASPFDTDGIQICSNSYGYSWWDADGWDFDGQFVSFMQRAFAPFTQYLFSTGNGAPAYGTINQPQPSTGIMVGASTEFGSTGWDSITDTHQIMNNDVTPFSNRGPSARGTHGTDVVAGGAYAAGDEELNYYSISTWGVLDGNLSWVSWGGTSRSAPVAMGVLALIYQAFYNAQGTWPTYSQAEALLMSTATDLNYDVFTQGAGSVNADRGTAVAGGLYGIVATPSEWQPGDYRGTYWPGFAHIAYPGNVFTESFQIANLGTQPITVDIDDTELMLIDSVELTLTVTADQAAQEDDNFFKAFSQFIPITAVPGMDPSWYNVAIPPDTDLMIVRQMFPYEEYDYNGDYLWDNRFYLMVYNWQDEDGDGIVWDDKDGNGVVNFVNSGIVTLIDGGDELVWDDPATELDRWEFGRFSYHRPAANNNEMWVHDPLERMIDGLFIGLRHHPGSTYPGDSHLRYRIDFYREEDVPWLTTDVANMLVSAHSSGLLVATATVPLDIPPGVYQAAIQIHDPGYMTYTADTVVIPVTLDVAEPFTDGMQFGGYDSYLYDQDRTYNNAAVRGLQDWTWREESGDWRFFFSDLENCVPAPPTCTYPLGTQMLVRDQWEDTDDAPTYSDIDTVVLGPVGTPVDPGWDGPYYLDVVAQSPIVRSGRATWMFDTSSGANEDWVMAPLPSVPPDMGGLNAFLQHNVLFEGLDFEVVFTKTVGTLWEDTHALYIDTFVDAGLVGDVVLESGLDLNGLEAYGYIQDVLAESWPNEPLDFVAPYYNEWTYVFTVTNGTFIELWTSSPDISDIDLFLYYWDGAAWQRRGSSTGATASEHIYLSDPEDGQWMIGVDNWSGPAGHFNLDLLVGVRFPGIIVTGTTTNPIPAHTPVTLTISYDYPFEPDTCYDAYVYAGPPEAPKLKEIYVEICRLPDSAMVRKEVNYETAFPGMELEYGIDLFNVSDPGAYFEFTDPIPVDTEFVTVTGACCLLVPTSTLVFEEDFDTATPPALPTGWDKVDVSGTAGDWVTRAGTRYPSGYPAHSAPNLAFFNSWTAGSGSSTRLYRTTGLDLSSFGVITVSFWMFHDTGYSSSADRVQVQVSTDGGANWDSVGDPIARYDPGGAFWAEHSVDISAYAGLADVRIGFLGISAYGNDVHIDDVTVTAIELDCTSPVYDGVENEIVWSGPLRLSGLVPPPAEGFESGLVPPPGWAHVQNNPSETWQVASYEPHGGTYHAVCYYDPALVLQDEWLISPIVTGIVGGENVSLWTYGSVYWGVTPFDNYDINVWLVVNDLGDGDDVYLGTCDGDWPANWIYAQSNFALPAPLPAGDLRIGIQYYGIDGAEASVDDIALPAAPVCAPSCELGLTVRITDTVAPDTWITNTAWLQATHYLPQEDQVESTSDDAYTHIGAEDFETSYKDAPTEVIVGDTILYAVHVINSGDKLAYLTLTDPIPDGTTYVGHNSSPPYQHFAYNAAQNQMEWAGNIAPGEEWVFEFEVAADGVACGDRVTNTATIAWDGNTMDLEFATDIVCPPTAGFVPSATVVGPNVAITFTNTTVGTPPITYLWDFGDGITSTLEDPTHAFTPTGTYTVTLTATNAYGDDVATELITVKWFTIYLPLVVKSY